jgi:hypothetical protein
MSTTGTVLLSRMSSTSLAFILAKQNYLEFTVPVQQMVIAEQITYID